MSSGSSSEEHGEASARTGSTATGPALSGSTATDLPAETRRGALPSAIVETMWVVAVAVAVAIGVRVFLGQAFYIPSESMTPQLEIGDRVVVSKVAYRLHDPNRGDVVVFDCPAEIGCPQADDSGSLPARSVRVLLEAVGIRQPSTEEFIKRVVALPGETVEGRGGAVWVDGRRVVEPYLAPGTTTTDFPPTDVPADTVWVMGDNRSNSQDSRVFGPVPVDTVVGRSLGRIWPPARLGFM